MATQAGGGAGKGPKKPPKPRLVASGSKKTTIQRANKNPNVNVVSQGSVTYTPPANPVGEALSTVGAVVGETVATGKSKTAKQILKGGISRAEQKNQNPKVIREAQRRERVQERRENRQERRENRRENRQERRENRQNRDTSKATSGAGLTTTGGKATSGSPKGGGGGVRENVSKFRPGGGSREYKTYGSPPSFEKNPNVRYTALPGGGSEGGGGGGASASTSLSGVQNTDLDTLLGAKKGKRARRRRRTE